QLGYAAARRHVVMLDRPVRAVTAPLLSLLVAFLALVPLSIVFHAASDAVWIAVLASPPLIGLAAARSMWPRWIELGADGVLIPGFFRRRLLRYADIDVGIALGDRVVLSAHSGRRSIVLQCESTGGRAKAVGRLVEEAIGRAQRVAVIGSRAL